MTAGKLRDVVVGLLYLVLVAALVALSIAVYDKDFSNIVRVSLLTDDIGSSMQKGSDVEVRGIPIGSVTGISSNGSRARISLAIDADKAREIPSNVSAQLLPKTLFGERYVALILPGDGSGTLKSGDVIQQDTSSEAVELQSVLDKLLPVLQAVQPEKLSDTLGAIAAALRDCGAELGTTITTLTRYLREFAPKVPALTSDLDALASVASTYTSAAPPLLDTLANLTTTSETVVAEQQQLITLFRTVTVASRSVRGFLQTNSADIISLAADSLPSLRALARYSSEFPCVAQSLAGFVPTANTAFGAGTNQPGLHVVLNVVPSMGKYLAGTDKPSYTASGAPQCPYVPTVGAASGLSGTALGTGTATTATTQSVTTGSPGASALAPGGLVAGNGLGIANSPQENALIAELVAPTLGMAPSRFPDWSSLLLGPALRGTQVSIR